MFWKTTNNTEVTVWLLRSAESFVTDFFMSCVLLHEQWSLCKRITMSRSQKFTEQALRKRITKTHLKRLCGQQKREKHIWQFGNIKVERKGCDLCDLQMRKGMLCLLLSVPVFATDACMQTDFDPFFFHQCIPLCIRKIPFITVRFQNFSSRQLVWTFGWHRQRQQQRPSLTTVSRGLFSLGKNV